MRFKPYIRADLRPVTRRRLTAARKAIDKERAGWGMFAGQMVTETPEERIARVDAGVQAGVHKCVTTMRPCGGGGDVPSFPYCPSNAGSCCGSGMDITGYPAARNIYWTSCVPEEWTSRIKEGYGEIIQGPGASHPFNGKAVESDGHIPRPG